MIFLKEGKRLTEITERHNVQDPTEEIQNRLEQERERKNVRKLNKELGTEKRE